LCDGGPPGGRTAVLQGDTKGEGAEGPYGGRLAVAPIDPINPIDSLGGVRYHITGGVDGGRGWKGDVKVMSLDVKTMLSLGWEPRYTSDEAVRKTAEALLREME